MRAGEVEAWTDGSGTSEGPWGSAAIVRFCDRAGEIHEREFVTYGDEGTNNVGELMAAILALESLKRPCNVKVVLDSEYVMYGFHPCDGQPEGRVPRWKRKGWINSQKEPVKNKDLWLRLEVAVERQLSVCWEHVDGHTGIILNERCDELAGLARRVAKGELSLADLFAAEHEAVAV